MATHPSWQLLHSQWHCDGTSSVPQTREDPDSCSLADSCLGSRKSTMELQDIERGPRRILKHLQNRKHPPTRLDMPRMSLLGKPINYRPPRHRDPRYRKAQLAVYNTLDRPRGFIAVIYHMLMWVLIVLFIYLSIYIMSMRNLIILKKHADKYIFNTHAKIK